MPADKVPCEQTETKISKRSFVSVEIFILAVVMVGSLVGTWNSLNNSIQKNSANIEYLTRELSALSVGMVKIEETLTNMLIESRVQNELTKAQIGDRWTAAMEERLQARWKEIIKTQHPSIKRTDFPDVREIQGEFGFAQ